MPVGVAVGTRTGGADAVAGADPPPSPPVQAEAAAITTTGSRPQGHPLATTTAPPRSWRPPSALHTAQCQSNSGTEHIGPEALDMTSLTHDDGRTGA